MKNACLIKNDCLIKNACLIKSAYLIKNDCLIKDACLMKDLLSTPCNRALPSFAGGRLPRTCTTARHVNPRNKNAMHSKPSAVCVSPAVFAIRQRCLQLLLEPLDIVRRNDAPWQGVIDSCQSQSRALHQPSATTFCVEWLHLSLSIAGPREEFPELLRTPSENSPMYQSQHCDVPPRL